MYKVAALLSGIFTKPMQGALVIKTCKCLLFCKTKSFHVSKISTSIQRPSDFMLSSVTFDAMHKD